MLDLDIFTISIVSIIVLSLYIFINQMLGHNKIGLPIIMKVSYFIYIIFLIDTTLMPFPMSREVVSSEPKLNNWIPLLTMYRILLSPYGFYIGLINILNKIIAFIPLGLLTPLVFKNRDIWFTIKISLTFGIFIEIIQATVNVLIKYNYQSINVDDIILGFTGTMFGFLIVYLINKKFY